MSFGLFFTLFFGIILRLISGASAVVPEALPGAVETVVGDAMGCTVLTGFVGREGHLVSAAACHKEHVFDAL